MAKYKGKDVIVLSEQIHDNNDYATVKFTINGEESIDRVLLKEITPEHSEQLSKHVPIAVVKDSFHPRYKKEDK